MTTAKLTYFNATGLGEAIRFLLSYGGIEFEDDRHTFESFAAIKDSLPLGQVPVLEIEGKKLFQAAPICRFLAKKLNLTGKDDEDSIRCDIAVETMQDLRSPLVKYFFEKNEARKKEMYADTMKTVNYHLDKLEGYLAKNDGHFLKGQLSWADFWFAGISNILCHFAGKDLYVDKPNLKALKQKVESLPAVSKYIEKRPAVP